MFSDKETKKFGLGKFLPLGNLQPLVLGDLGLGWLVGDDVRGWTLTGCGFNLIFTKYVKCYQV